MNIHPEGPRPLTVKAATEILRGFGAAITCSNGDYRVAIPGQGNFKASNLSDAVFTMLEKANASTQTKVDRIKNQITAFKLARH